MRQLTGSTRIRIKRPRPPLTGDTRIRLSQIKDLQAWINDAENLPPRKWADGKMHEKVAGEWREVSEAGNNGNNWSKLTEAQKKEFLISEFKKMGLPEKKEKGFIKMTKNATPKNIEYIKENLDQYRPENLGLKPSKPTEHNSKSKPLTGETKIKITPALKEEIRKSLPQQNKQSSSDKEKPTVTNGFESWQGIKELDKKLRPKWQQLKRKLKKSELSAIKDWQQPLEGDKYEDIQSFTRDPVNYTHMKKGQQIRGLTKEQVAGIVNNLDSAFKKTPEIGTNLTVVSGQGDYSMFFNSWGIKETNLDKLAEAIKKHKGETLTNKSYLSASVNEKGAEGWWKDPVEVRIDVPKDKKAIYLGNMNDDDYKGEPGDELDENELFINRGAKYRLDDVKIGRNRAGKKAVLVKMTLTGDGTEK